VDGHGDRLTVPGVQRFSLGALKPKYEALLLEALF
jgi:hypothetical protein